MLHALNSLLAPAVMQRVTLLVNHILAGEAAATQRLVPHAGKCLSLALQNWPALLPPPPPLMFRITPAGMFEWCDAPAEGLALPAAELTLRIDASNPALLLAQAVGGIRPEAVIEGDAVLAAEISWLMQNLRWDIAGDLERIFPTAVVQGLVSFGTAVASALRSALQRAMPPSRRAP